MTISNGWGVPDWEDAEAYPKPNDRDHNEMLVWAWEFLRRNPDYRRFYADKIAPLIVTQEEECAPVGETDCYPIRELEMFGLIGSAPNPAIGIGAGAFFKVAGTRELRPRAFSKGEPQAHQVKLRPNEVGYLFDLAFPLEGQFAMALIQAKDLQKRRSERGDFAFTNTKSRTEKYVLYLRIIDALDLKVDSKKIADTIFPRIENTPPEYYRKQTFQNHEKRALRIRDSGYIRLAAMAASDVAAKYKRVRN